MKSLVWTIYGAICYSLSPLFFINKFKINKINLGDLIYDSWIRWDQKFLKNFIDLKFLKILYVSIFKFNNIFNELKNIKEDFVCLISSISHASDSNFALRISLKLNKKVYLHNYAALNLYEKYEDAYRSPYKLKLKDIKNYQVSEKRLKLFLKNRYKGNNIGIYTNSFEIKKVYLNKKVIMSRDHLFKVLGVKQTKKIILFAAHAFSDAPHGGAGGSNFIFKDYFELFKKTLKQIKKNDDDNTLWIIKEHPSAGDYNEIGIINNLMKIYKFKNLKNFPEEYSLSSFFPHLDTVITGRGTIAMEAASFGIKPIICGETPFSDLGFTQEPKNQKEYFNNILKFNFENKLSKKMISRAQKVLYILENYRHDKIIDSSLFINKVDKAISQNEREYIKKINKKKITLNKITKDKYYKSLEKFINKEFGK